MSKTEKLIERFMKKPVPSDITLNEVDKLMKLLGFVLDRVTGSHHIYKHKKGRDQVIPKPTGKHVKRAYIKEIQLLIEEFGEDSQ